MSSTSLSSTGAVSVVRVATTITLGLNRTVYYEGHEPKHNLKKKLSFKIKRFFKIFHDTNVHFMSPAGLNLDLGHQLVCFCRRVTFTYDKVVVQPPVLLVSWSPRLRYIKLGKGRLFSAVHSTIIKLRFSCNSLGAAVG